MPVRAQFAGTSNSGFISNDALPALTEWTVSCFGKSSDLAGALLSIDAGGFNDDFLFGPGAEASIHTGFFGASIQRASDSSRQIAEDFLAVDSAAHYWGASFGSGRLRLWRDGMCVGYKDVTGTCGIKTGAWSCAKTVGGTNWAGEVSSIRIWSRELTHQEHATLAFDGTYDNTDLEAEWLLNEGAGSTANDTSGNGHHATLTNVTWVSNATDITDISGNSADPLIDFALNPKTGPFPSDPQTDGCLVWARQEITCEMEAAVYDDASRLSLSSGLTVALARLGQQTPAIVGGKALVDVVADDNYSAKIKLGGLQPDTQYYGTLAFVDGGTRSFDIEWEFRTRPADTVTTPSFTWLVFADLDSADISVMEDDMLFEGASFAAFLGDLHYRDGIAISQATYRIENQRQYERVEWKASMRFIPMVYTCDDHDFGANDADGTAPFENENAGAPSTRYTECKQVMCEQMGVYEVEGDGIIYRKFKWGTLFEFIVIDMRSYRDRNVATDNSSKTLLGAGGSCPVDQKQWLIDAINNCKASYCIVIAGMPLYNDTTLSAHTDGPWVFSNERDAIMAACKRRVLWQGGDLHIAQLHRVTANNWFNIVVSSLTYGRTWSEKAVVATGVTRDGGVAFDTGTSTRGTNQSYNRFAWDASAKVLTLDFMRKPTTLTDAGTIKTRIFQMPVVDNVGVTNRFKWSDGTMTINGSGFISTKSTGQVFISSTEAVGAGTQVEQTVNSWNDTQIVIALTQGDLPSAGRFYLHVVNDDSIYSLALEVNVATTSILVPGYGYVSFASATAKGLLLPGYGYMNFEIGDGTTVPDAPTAVTGSPGDEFISVTGVAPADDGGQPITGYVADDGADNETAAGSLPRIVTGLDNGTPYTVRLAAVNVNGQGAWGVASAPVTPQIPAFKRAGSMALRRRKQQQRNDKRRR